MKNFTNLIYIIIVAGTATIFSTAHAATISYQGTITPPFSSGIGSGSTGGQSWVDENGDTDFWSTVTGLVGGDGWIEEIAEETDFWSFSVGPGGVSLDIWAFRDDESTGLDPALSIYSGITTADESEFLITSDFGGITFSEFADDEIPSEVGPFGDPAIYNMAFDEGIYTIAIGGYASDSEGPFSYELSIGTPGSAPVPAGFEPSPVPIPGAFWFFATGLLGFVSARKSK